MHFLFVAITNTYQTAHINEIICCMLYYNISIFFSSIYYLPYYSPTSEHITPSEVGNVNHIIKLHRILIMALTL